jgi:FAD/FMN-containing dehydrogenase
MAARGSTIAEKLRDVLRGRVVDDDTSLQQFSRDQSMYQIKPLAVGLPEDVEDVQRLVLFAKREGVPITARGGGSGTAGSALGQGLVLALPRGGFWERISGFSSNGRVARVSAAAGVYHNDLQKFLKERGFFLPADVTSAGISRIGGNIATKASGPHALKYGSIDRFLESVEFVTAKGERVDTADEATIPQRFKNDLADLERRIRRDEASRTVLESRKGLKTASGYNLFAFISNGAAGRLIAQLMAGSVGTLGLITRATLLGEVQERERAAVVLSFEDLEETGRAVCALREMDVAAIELISRETLGLIRERADLPPGLLDPFAVGAHALVVELTGPERLAGIEQITALVRRKGYRLGAPTVVAVREEEIEKLWNLRKQILWLIEHPKPGLRAPAVVNDVGVPPERLAGFIGAVQHIFDKQGVIAAIYGHAGNGNLHLRPLFDTALPDLREKIRSLAEDVYEAVLLYGGTVTAEHGMGRLRAPYLKREWGEALYGYMREVKNIFDPQELLNPGVMFGNAPITDHMRTDLLQP